MAVFPLQGCEDISSSSSSYKYSKKEKGWLVISISIKKTSVPRNFFLDESSFTIFFVRSEDFSYSFSKAAFSIKITY
jgi:hypothetical protein